MTNTAGSGPGKVKYAGHHAPDAASAHILDTVHRTGNDIITAGGNPALPAVRETGPATCRDDQQLPATILIYHLVAVARKVLCLLQAQFNYFPKENK